MDNTPGPGFGGTPVGKVKLRPHPPGQNRLGTHPNTQNAATGIRTVAPTNVGFKNRVGKKGY